jgi:hypothetical protein
MTNIIKHKRSDVTGAVPAADNLSAGELAVNTADGKLFTRKADGTVVELTQAASVDGGEIVYDSLLNGLHAFWLFDQTVGNVPDVSGNSHPLFVPVSATTATPSVQNTGLTLSHANFLYAPHSFSTRRTIAFWLKIYAAPEVETTILSFGPFGVLNETGYVQINSNRTLSWTEQTTASSSPATSAAAIPVDAWTHITLVRETIGSNAAAAKIYINGVLNATATGLTDTLTAIESDVVTFGSFNPAVNVSFDCAGIWDRALTAAEAARLFNGGGAAYSLPPIAAMPIDPASFINVSTFAPVASLAISVAGSTGALFPAFNTNIHDYGVLTSSATLGNAVTYTLTVNGVAITDSAPVGKIIRVAFGSSAYYIRLLPSDMPLGTITTQPTTDYIPGYYLTTSRRDINAANYNVIYDENGLPFWYSQEAGLPQINHPGNDRNTVVISRRNGTSGQRYVINLTASAALSRGYSFLPTTKNGTTYTSPIIDWQQHELLQLSGPPNRRGNVLTVAFPTTPAAGSQQITDKAYGIYIQEQTPTTGQVAWDWWTGNYFNQTAATQVSSFFHMNSADVHPVTGDVLCSMRNCSALMCIDGTTKAVKWVIQGPPSTTSVTLAAVADPTTTADTQYLTLDSEPTHANFQYIGTCGQHHARWCPHVDPLTPGNQVITIFDNQTNFFAGAASQISLKTVTSLIQSGTTVTGVATAHGFTTGSYVQISGANQSAFNGVFLVTKIDNNTFTYTLPTANSVTANGTITAVKAQNYFPNGAPYARGVMYEIDLAQNKAVHRSSIFSTVGPSGYLGSYHVVLHKNGAYSHVIDFNGQHPQLVEYADAGDGASPGVNPVFAVDFPGDLYRILKVEKEFFDADYLRSTAGLTPTIVN